MAISSYAGNRGPKGMIRAVISAACAAMAAFTIMGGSATAVLAEAKDAASGFTDAGSFILTAYCSCPECCGKWAENRPNGIVYTASGAQAETGVTVAVDPKVIPLGTSLRIDGLGDFIAQDTGSGVKGKHLDIYMDSHEEALRFMSDAANSRRQVWLLSGSGAKEATARHAPPAQQETAPEQQEAAVDEVIIEAPADAQAETAQAAETEAAGMQDTGGPTQEGAQEQEDAYGGMPRDIARYRRINVYG